MPGIGVVKMNKVGAGEVAQWLRALAALPEVPGLIPSTHNGNCVSTPVCNPSFRGFNTLTQT